MGDTVMVPLRQMVDRVVGYLPQLFAGLAVVALGWLLAWLVKKLVIRFVIVLRLHRIFEKSRWGTAMRKGDVRYTFIEAVGNLSFVFVFLIFLDNAIVVWQLDALGRLLNQFILYLPQIAAGTVIFVVGMIAANYVSRRVETFLQEAEFEQSFFISGLVKAGIIVFVVALTLDQLSIAPRVVLGAFLITGGSLGAAVVLAFGLGSREAVSQFWKSLGKRRSPGPK